MVDGRIEREGFRREELEGDGRERRGRVEVSRRKRSQNVEVAAKFREEFDGV